MRRETQQEILESVFVEMAPVLHGFTGVLLELFTVGEGYAVLEPPPGAATASSTFSPRARTLPGRYSTPSCAGAAAIP